MIDSAILYIINTFGVKIIEEDLHDLNKIPLYLCKGYDYKIIEFLDKSFILAFRISKENLNIDNITNQISKIKSFLNYDYPIILVFDNVNTYLRKQLINERISFIVPGKMIFIFELGSILYERKRSNYAKVKEIINDKMTPSTQALFMYLITSDSFNRSMEYIANKLDLTKMSVSRGFNELHSLGIVEKNEYVESSKYRFGKNRKDVWTDAQKFLINPVLKTITVHKDIVDTNNYQFSISGESALTEISMLSSPNIIVNGITNKLFK